METKELTHKKVKMSRETALNFALFIQSFDNWEALEPKLPQLHPKFVNALVKNVTILEPLTKEFTKLKKTEKAYIEYEREKLKLEEQNAVKDDKGKAVSRQGQFWIENANAHAFDLLDLQDKHRAAVDARQEYLEGEIELKLYTVERQYAPKKGFPPVTGNKFLDYFVVGEVIDVMPEEVPVEETPAPKAAADA